MPLQEEHTKQRLKLSVHVRLDCITRDRSQVTRQSVPMTDLIFNPIDDRRLMFEMAAQVEIF